LSGLSVHEASISQKNPFGANKPLAYRRARPCVFAHLTRLRSIDNRLSQ
jgi:hypothetical protein